MLKKISKINYNIFELMSFRIFRNFFQKLDIVGNCLTHFSLVSLDRVPPSWTAETPASSPSRYQVESELPVGLAEVIRIPAR